MKHFAFLALAFYSIFVESSAHANTYIIDKNQSVIEFSGTHAGNNFRGIFEEWDAEISFDINHLDSSAIRAVFKTDTAKTGNKMFDGTLPQKDWFDSTNYPEAGFQSKTISLNEDGSFKAEGVLTIRDIAKPLSFDFSLSKLEDESTHAKAEFSINRLDYDIGRKSDETAEWVGQDIAITLDIKAKSSQQR